MNEDFVTNIMVGVARVDARKFDPIIARFPIARKVLDYLFQSGEIENDDNPLLYGVRQLLGIPECYECVYLVSVNGFMTDGVRRDFEAELQERWEAHKTAVVWEVEL